MQLWEKKLESFRATKELIPNSGTGESLAKLWMSDEAGTS